MGLSTDLLLVEYDCQSAGASTRKAGLSWRPYPACGSGRAVVFMFCPRIYHLSFVFCIFRASATAVLV